MEKDNIKNAKNYYYLSKNIEIALKYLENNDFSRIENGKYEIAGKDIYAIVQEYETKNAEDAKFEAHKIYTDIQFLVFGEEKIGVSGIENFDIFTEYDAQKDIMFLSPKDNIDKPFYDMEPGDFMILEPNDAHMPSIFGNAPKTVKKAVVKVKK